MRAHILQHVPFEGIGSIQSWLEARQAEITYTRFFEKDQLPEIKGLDLVVIMGGPMSANDESALPWIGPEKSFLRSAIHEGVSTVGICLGAQLIASALGARVYKNACKEIGWFPIVATPYRKDSFHFPEQFLALHWHGETFDLPPGAIHLARSSACENQAFQIGKQVIGLQFHLETTPESLDALVENCLDELTPGPFIQNEKRLRPVAYSVYVKINSIMGDLLSYITAVSS